MLYINFNGLFCLVFIFSMAGIYSAMSAETSNNFTASCPDKCNLNHGYCQPDNRCSCYSGWHGENCERCVRSPGCMHGTCDRPGECKCLEGYGGRHCQLDLRYCERHSPCRNRATCVNDGNGSYRCICRPGFIGKTCIFPITTTAPSAPDSSFQPFCLHGGTCVFGNGIVGCEKCSCPSGYVGNRCEILVRMCVQRPCANGGRCIDLPNNFKCICAEGFYGPFCNQDIDECQQKGDDACENGGTCVNRKGSYMCVCREGFEGVRCDKPIQRIPFAPPTIKPSFTRTTSSTSRSALNTLVRNRPGSKPVPAMPPPPVEHKSSTNIKVTHIVSQVELESSHSEVINHVIDENGFFPINHHQQQSPTDQQSSVPLVQAVTFAFLGVAVALFIGIGLIVSFNMRKGGKFLNCKKHVTEVDDTDGEEIQLNEKQNSDVENRSLNLKQNNLKEASHHPKPGLVVRTITPPRGKTNLKSTNNECYYVQLPRSEALSGNLLSTVDETSSLVESTKLNRSVNFFAPRR